MVAAAVVEKAAALMTVEYLEERGRSGSWEKFDAALASVPDVEPEDRDQTGARDPFGVNISRSAVTSEFMRPACNAEETRQKLS